MGDLNAAFILGGDILLWNIGGEGLGEDAIPGEAFGVGVSMVLLASSRMVSMVTSRIEADVSTAKEVDEKAGTNVCDAEHDETAGREDIERLAGIDDDGTFCDSPTKLPENFSSSKRLCSRLGTTKLSWPKLPSI